MELTPNAFGASLHNATPAISLGRMCRGLHGQEPQDYPDGLGFQGLGFRVNLKNRHRSRQDLGLGFGVSGLRIRIRFSCVFLTWGLETRKDASGEAQLQMSEV